MKSFVTPMLIRLFFFEGKMRAIFDKGISLVHKLLAKGFFHIFIGNSLVKIVSMCSAILLPRILVPESVYGILGTVDNVNSYLILVNGFGLANSVLRFCAMKDEKIEKSAVFHFCLRLGLIIDFIILIVFTPILMFSPFFANGNYGIAKQYILIACFIPILTYIQEIVMLYMRANTMNKMFSKISVLYTVLYAGFQVILAFFFSLKGVFIGRYIALSLVSAICFWLLYHHQVLSDEKIKLSLAERKAILYYGIGTMITNAFSLIMPYNETLVVNLVLKDLSTTAYYKAASMIPSNLQYIATSVVVFVFPYFAKHTGDGRWIQKNTYKVCFGMMGLMIPIILVGYVLSPAVINIIYGVNYAPAIEIMKPMWIAFGINAVLRIPIGNILAALGELRFNMILSAFMCIIHAFFDYYFISNVGIGGAAFALIITYVLSGVISLIFLNYKCQNAWKGVA